MQTGGVNWFLAQNIPLLWRGRKQETHGRPPRASRQKRMVAETRQGEGEAVPSGVILGLF